MVCWMVGQGHKMCVFVFSRLSSVKQIVVVVVVKSWCSKLMWSVVVVDGVLNGWLGSQNVSSGWHNSHQGSATTYHRRVHERSQLHLVPADHSGTHSYLTHTNTGKGKVKVAHVTTWPVRYAVLYHCSHTHTHTHQYIYRQPIHL